MPADTLGTELDLGVKRQAVWSLLAQGLASANGLVTAIVAARSMSPGEFGTFSALMTLTIIFVGLIAAFLAQPLLLTRGGRESVAVQARSTLVAAAALGGLAGLITAAGSTYFDGMRPDLLVLALSLPLMAVCDAFRYVATVLGHARKAAMFDAARLALFLGLYAVFLSGSRQDSTSFAILWCGCAVVIGFFALIVGLRLTSTSPMALRKFTTVKFLGYQFSLEYFIGIFGSAVPTLSLGGFVSVEAIGHFRGVSTLFGPILVVATSAVLVLSPILVRRSPTERTWLLVGMAAVFNVTTLLWMVVLLAIPDAVGRQLLGEVWFGSSELIVPAALQTVGLGILTTAQTGIRVARPRMSFVMNVCAVAAAAGSFIVGVLAGGLQGAVWGFAFGAFGAAAIAITIYVWVKDTPGVEQ